MLNQPARFSAHISELWERVEDFVASGRLDYFHSALAQGRDTSVYTEYGPYVEPLYALAVSAVAMVGYRLVVFQESSAPPALKAGADGLCSYREHCIYIKQQNRTTMTRVLLHELTHAVLEDDVLPLSFEYEHARLIRVTEQLAEAASALVMFQYGFDVFSDCVPYLATWGLHESDYGVRDLMAMVADELYYVLEQSRSAIAA